MTQGPKVHRYYLLTLDPVHVGTGGAQLGRVDNPIVREPGTRIPKIPGSSLHGMIRAYAAQRYGKHQCAGQGKNHCAQPTCPICYTFGHARDKEGGKAGVVAISDARILLFPVYSMVGPVWVTSPSALQDAGFRDDDRPSAYFEVDANGEGKARWPDALSAQAHLNLGWLMVERDKNNSEWKPEELFKEVIPEPIRNRVVLVSDKLFSQIVNSNLEVRTSVAINPETGAAEERALFTYEAIPRATVLWMDVVVSDYRKFPNKKSWQEICSETEIPNKLDEEPPPSETDFEKVLQKLGYISSRPKRREGEAGGEYSERLKKYWGQVRRALDACKHALEMEWEQPLDIVSFGLEWAEYLGVGGMGTRGFGRIRKIADCIVSDQGKCEKQGTDGNPQNTGG